MYDNEVLSTGNITRLYQVIVPKKAREFVKLAEGQRQAIWFADENDLCLKFVATAEEVEQAQADLEVLGVGLMDSKFRVVVPAKIRATVGLTQEDQVVWYTDGFNLCLKFLSAREMHRLLVAMDRVQEGG